MSKIIAILGSALFFLVAPAMLAGVIPWLITHWEFRPPFLAAEATRLAGLAFIIAGVPNPCSAKRANESTSPGRPATINRIPTARVASRSKKGGRNSQRVINQGKSPATELGATAKKRAEPNTAIVFRTAPPSRPVAMSMQQRPVSALSG